MQFPSFVHRASYWFTCIYDGGMQRACMTPLHLYEEIQRVCTMPLDMLKAGERVHFHPRYMEKVMRQTKIESQKLATRDLSDCAWRFAHIYRGQPTWTLVPGNEFHFLRKEGGSLLPYAQVQKILPMTSLVSSQGIHACQ